MRCIAYQYHSPFCPLFYRRPENKLPELGVLRITTDLEEIWVKVCERVQQIVNTAARVPAVSFHSVFLGWMKTDEVLQLSAVSISANICL